MVAEMVAELQKCGIIYIYIYIYIYVSGVTKYQERVDAYMMAARAFERLPREMCTRRYEK
jgi:hypothetical protein